jgi:hypothetical protein
MIVLDHSRDVARQVALRDEPDGDVPFNADLRMVRVATRGRPTTALAQGARFVVLGLALMLGLLPLVITVVFLVQAIRGR